MRPLSRYHQVFQATATQQPATGGVGLGWIALVVILLTLGALALLFRRGYKARRSLERRVAELSALSEAGRAIVAAQLDVDALCTLIHDQACKIVDTSTFQLGLFEGTDYHIKVWIVRGEHKPGAVFDLSESPGIIGWMRRTGLPLLVRDFQIEMETLPAHPAYLSDHPPRSAVFVPLVAGETVIGAMGIQSDRPAAFTQDHQRILSIIANQAAAAIANAHLYRAERRRRRSADKLRQTSTLLNSSLEVDEVLQAVLEGLEHLVAFDAAAVLLPGEDRTLTLEAARGLPAVVEALGQSWPMADTRRLRQLAQARRTMIFGPDDEMGVYHRLLSLPPDHSCLGAPIVIRDQLIGIVLLDRREPGQYDADDAASLTALAGQAASALENARLYAEGQEEAWISMALLEVAEATSLTKSVDEVLETVVRLTPLLVGVDHCAILMWRQEKQVHQVAAAYALADSVAGLQVGHVISPGTWSLLDRLWESGSPVVDEFGSMPGAPATQDVETTLLALPLRAQGDLTGAMVIRFTGQIPFTEHRIKLIAGIANQAALAIESAQLVVAQQEEAWVSLALLQVAEAVANLSELDDVLAVIARLTPLLVGVESCLVYLWDAERQLYQPGAAYGIPLVQIERFQATPIPVTEWPGMYDAGMADTPVSSVEHLSYADAGGRADHVPWEPNGQAFLIPGPPPAVADVLGLHFPLSLPLLAWGKLMGAMVVDILDGDTQLADRRLNILSGVAQQTATAIQNSRLYAESVERQQLERELQVAREIQASFLPDAAPRIPGWDLGAYWQGARQVSGDFYDFVPLSGKEGTSQLWGFVVADVADKGVPAALFMALSRTLVRTVAIGGTDPAQVLAQVNDLILSNASSELFVTLFYAILNPDRGVLSFANGGHNPPLLFGAGSSKVTFLEARGMALGVMPGIELERHEITLRPGDLVLFYTDGVTDALNHEVDEFGLQRLCRVVEAHQTESAADVIHAINQAVAAFVGDTPQFDDFTLVVLKREPCLPLSEGG